MIARRDALRLLAALTAAACAPSRDAIQPSAARKRPALRLDPVVDLVPAAGLVWLVDARPRELVADPVASGVLTSLVSGRRFDGFAARYGADLRDARELVIAAFPEALLVLAALPIDPPRLEQALAARALSVEGRAERDGIVRSWGTVRREREELALFEGGAAALERRSGIQNGAGPLDAAVYFAQGRLRRSSPALKADPLAAAAARLGSAPVRGFAPGPFAGDWASGLAGLLQATTALGVAVSSSPPETLVFRVVLTGAWGAEAPAAAQRLDAAFRVLTEDALGHLLGLEAAGAARSAGDPTSLELTVPVDAAALIRGLRAVTDASVSEIMAF
ncbi:MAG TPA: hypothetical protein VKU41_11430 [Polyangiaceae bacterium]|nr:hypothetical protein [Polyangiaceae bacterium]